MADPWPVVGPGPGEGDRYRELERAKRSHTELPNYRELAARADQRLIEQLVEALEKARDTFGDFEMSFKLLRREPVAEAARIAGRACDAALAAARGEMPCPNNCKDGEIYDGTSGYPRPCCHCLVGPAPKEGNQNEQP